MTLGRRYIVAIAFLLPARHRGAPEQDSGRSAGSASGAQTGSGPSQTRGADERSDGIRSTGDSAVSLTPAKIEELTDKLAERREKLDYFYITAFTAILVFTFNNFNSRTGVLIKAPVWLVELGWGSLIVAALCPLYVISARFKRFAMNMDRQVGKPFDEPHFKGLRRRIEFVHHAMTLFFVVGVGALCIAYALGLNQIKR